jgi:hypothetical protein
VRRWWRQTGNAEKLARNADRVLEEYRRLALTRNTKTEKPRNLTLSV